MIAKISTGQDFRADPRVPAATLQDQSDQHGFSIVHDDHNIFDHSHRPSRATSLDAGTPAPQAADSGLSEGSQSKDSESARRAVLAEESLSVRSIIDFGEDQGLHVRQSGLFLPEKMSFDSWRELGCRIARVANCAAWWLGDWLLYGAQSYSDRYEQAIADTSLGYQTLRNYAWVARKFPMSRRRDTLSFGHHAEVAALPDDEQDMWLTRAEHSKWSRSQLRRGLRAERRLYPRQPGDERSIDTTALKIDVSAERHNRWESAAKQKNTSVAEWIIATLDRAASEELGKEMTSAPR